MAITWSFGSRVAVWPSQHLHGTFPINNIAEGRSRRAYGFSPTMWPSNQARSFQPCDGSKACYPSLVRLKMASLQLRASARVKTIGWRWRFWSLMNSIHHIVALLRLLSYLKEGGEVRVKLSAPPQGLEWGNGLSMANGIWQRPQCPSGYNRWITRDTRGSLMGAVFSSSFFSFLSFVKRGNWPLAMGLLYLNMTSAIRPSTECSSVLQSVLHRSSRGKNPRHGIFLSGRRSTGLSYRRRGGFICLARSNGWSTWRHV